MKENIDFKALRRLLAEAGELPCLGPDYDLTDTEYELRFNLRRDAPVLLDLAESAEAWKARAQAAEVLVWLLDPVPEDAPEATMESAEWKTRFTEARASWLALKEGMEGQDG